MPLSPYSTYRDPPLTLEEVEEYRKELYNYQYTRDISNPGEYELHDLITEEWLDGLEDVFDLVDFLAEKYNIRKKDWDRKRRELERKVETLQKRTIELENTVKELQGTNTTQESAILITDSV